MNLRRTRLPIGEDRLEALCRNLAVMAAAAFTTYVIATWGRLGEHQLQMAVGVLAVWAAVTIQVYADRRLRAGR